MSYQDKLVRDAENEIKQEVDKYFKAEYISLKKMVEQKKSLLEQAEKTLKDWTYEEAEKVIILKQAAPSTDSIYGSKKLNY